MSHPFVRVSVFHDERQLDVSLPLSRPAVDIVADIVDLLDQHEKAQRTSTGAPTDAQSSIATADTHTWVLSLPKTGAIDPHATLAEFNVQDGDKLYLTRREEAAHTPFVDDALAEVRNTIAAAQWGYSGEVRSSGVFGVVAAVLTLTTLTTDARIWNQSLPLTPESWFMLGAAWIATLTLFGLAVWRRHSWMRWLGFAIPITTAATARVFFASLPATEAFPWWVAVVAIAFAPAVWAAGRRVAAGGLAGVVACTVASVFATAVAGAVMAGANIYAVCAWGAWVPILILLIAPSVGLRATGLPTLIRQNDAGDPVKREAIRAYSRRAEAASRGAAWAAAALALGVVLCLATSPVWQHGLIALMVVVATVLRQNGFADARIITVLNSVGILGASLIAGALVRWGQEDWQTITRPDVWWGPSTTTDLWVWIATFATLIVTLLLMLVLQLPSRDEVQKARNARTLSFLDVVVCLAVIPLILACQGLYQYYWATT